MGVIAGPMVAALKGQKLMDGSNRNWVTGADPQLTATRCAVR
jgi:hypothetical protein